MLNGLVMRSRTPRRSSLQITMPNLRNIAIDSSEVMLAFLERSNPYHRLKFGAPLSQVFCDDRIPAQLLDLLRYLNAEGVTVPDIFRRPGNANELKKVINRLTEGKQVKYCDYNFYTLASVLKRFLLSVPGGILGPELEEKLIASLYYEDREQRIMTVHKTLRCLPTSIQRFLTLLFGVWYRITDHHHHHNIKPEAMAKSVTGSIFVNSTSSPKLVNKAAQVMEFIIENYAEPLMFGEDNLQYFTDVTDTNIERCNSAEQLILDNLGNNNEHLSEDGESSDACIEDQIKIEKSYSLERTHHLTRSLTRQEAAQVRQLDRLKRRSEWFSTTQEENEGKASMRTSGTRAYRTTHSTSSLPERRFLSISANCEGIRF